MAAQQDRPLYFAALCFYLSSSLYGRPVGTPLYFAAAVSIFFFFFLSFLLAYSQRSQIGCLYHSSNKIYMTLVRIQNAFLKCAARGSLKYRTQKFAKICHVRILANFCVLYFQRTYSRTPSHNFVWVYVRNLGMHRQPEKTGYTAIGLCPPHVFTIWWTWPTSSWDRLAGLGHPSKFQRVSRLGFVTSPTSINVDQPNFARCLAVSWTGTTYIHFRGLLSPNGILPGEKIHVASTSCVLLYWQRYCTALEQCASSKLCGVRQRAPPIFGRAAITLFIGPHSSFIWTMFRTKQNDDPNDDDDDGTLP